MCGRYVLWEVDELTKLFNVDGLQDLEPNYNAAPTHLMPVYPGEKMINMRWGYIPVWAKDEKIGYKLFNTRSESVFEKTMWKSVIKRNRCLIPANGFYEWKKTADGKTPFFIHLPDEKLFSFAGIWDTWKHDGKEMQTFSILTTTPNAEMKDIHDRMPVIIDKGDYDMWLSADNEDDIKVLLQPLKDGSLDMHEVSKDVNFVKTNNKDLIKPLNSK